MSVKMGVSFDDYIRTTEERHKVSCAELWRRIEASGDIYLGHYEGWYAVRDEAFYDEDELTTRPDGSKVAPSGAPVEWVREPSYFFRLSAWQDRLLKLYEDQPDFILPASRRNEVMSFVRGGLRDLSISRTSFKWGIPVPGAPGHVMYVWLDALNNYVTACGFPDESRAALAILAGRCAFRRQGHHAVPRGLLAGVPDGGRAAGAEAGVLERLVDGRRREDEQVARQRHRAAATGRRPTGSTRCATSCCARSRSAATAAVSHQALITRINVELANDLGNLAQRSLSLIARNCEGRLPGRGPVTEDDAELLAAAEALPDLVRDRLDRQVFHEALEEVWKVVRAANGYIDRQAPWALRRTDPVRMAAVLRVLADVLRVIATVLQPFMPGSMARMLDQLGVPADARTLADLGAPLADGVALPAPQGVFPRYVEPAA